MKSFPAAGYKRFALCAALLLLAASSLRGQDSSVAEPKKPKEPLRLLSWADPHQPRKASIYSAVIPGLGQAYNRKWVKVPIVYASLGAVGWFTLDQRKQMRALNAQFKAAYAINSDTSLPALLLEQRDNYRRMRDFGILAFSALYVLQIVDATVDAHFYKMNINQDLSATLRPFPARFVSLAYRLR